MYIANHGIVVGSGESFRQRAVGRCKLVSAGRAGDAADCGLGAGTVRDLLAMFPRAKSGRAPLRVAG